MRNGHGARRGMARGVRDEPGRRSCVVGQGPVGTSGWGSGCTVGREGRGLAVGGRGFRSKTICGMGEGRCAREGEGQVDLQHPMGLGDKFCARDVINTYNIYEGQTLRMSSWSRIVFASISASVEERTTFASTICASVLEYIHLRARRASATNGERSGGGGRRYTCTRTQSMQTTEIWTFFSAVRVCDRQGQEQ